MKRLEYMSILRQKLVEGGLSNDEINDAMQFYEELFLDGGYENEEKTAYNLGDPETLAQQILAENGAMGFLKPEYKMDDAIDNRGKEQTTPPPPVDNIAPDNRKLALIVLLLLASPIWFPLAIGLLAGFVGLSIGLSAAMFAIGCVGVALIVSGVVSLFTAPPLGLVFVGTGMFLTGLAVLITIPFVKWLFGLVKRFVLWIVGSIRNLFTARTVSSNG